MSDIYEKHQNAFTNVSAYVIVKGGERVATVAFKFPKDGASKLWAYVHFFGVPMVRGSAGGYGYDKRSAACASASRAAPKDSFGTIETAHYEPFWQSLAKDDGRGWDDNLRLAGFTVWQAV